LRSLHDVERYALEVLVVDDDLEGVVARLLKIDAGEPEDDVGFEGAAGDTAGDDEGPFGLEELSTVGVDEPNFELVLALFGEIGAGPENEDHGGVSKGQLASPDGIEDAEDVEFAFLADVGGIGDNGEVYLHGR
jgi:hypothetical protein